MQVLDLLHEGFGFFEQQLVVVEELLVLAPETLSLLLQRLDLCRSAALFLGHLHLQTFKLAHHRLLPAPRQLPLTHLSPHHLLHRPKIFLEAIEDHVHIGNETLVLIHTRSLFPLRPRRRKPVF